MKYYIIAGEASGDLHASNLMRKIKEKDNDAIFRAWGGDMIKAQGAELVKHIRELAFMGFTEVILNLKTIKRNLNFCKEDILNYQPDALILVDYPGFNLRIAEYAHMQGIRVFYYISPQVWAWKKSRIKKIKKFVDHMFVILPFEKNFYKENNYEVTYVGHPLTETIEAFKTSMQDAEKIEEIESNKKLLLLLPGSRKQEIKKVLPLMLSVKDDFPELEWAIAAAPSIDKEFYEEVIQQKEIKIVYNKTYQLLNQAYAALVTSGTATLETALFNVPQVVCYKGGYLSYKIGRMLVNKKIVRFISLVNLILNKEVVMELIQNNFNKRKIKGELSRIIYEDNFRKEIQENYKNLHAILGNENTSEKVASLIIQQL